ncbi:hypothetical protein ABENE_13980 [Asticcacaulis benevestitus DSM 16100 = ATCC BAA-896]|uniref:Uncharacterized protein n=1 Tax=Asticcacaulis benevestitus DSM 16100 = ATCC BAA-896 TaxID=1121022 RepID=V4PQ80_9CAUL|nr:hypothetical protein ABENE_13980 [Asticcacaulis benevestitus DSM 16100 = ATCC BAA-896]
MAELPDVAAITGVVEVAPAHVAVASPVAVAAGAAATAVDESWADAFAASDFGAFCAIGSVGEAA